MMVNCQGVLFSSPGRRTVSRVRLVMLVAMAVTMAGCMTVDESVRYSLSQPSPGLVRHRVAQDDELELVLKDSSVVHLTVTAVDETSIHGQSGTTVPIDEISELSCTDSLSLAGAAGAVTFYGLAGPLSVLALPIVLPMALFYDWDSAGTWSDDHLCRATEHPDQYGYSSAGVHATNEDMPTLQEIVDERDKRELDCDPVMRAERKCAWMSTSGASFDECAALLTSMEQAGFAAVNDWSDDALCHVHQYPVFYHRVSDLDETQRKAVIESATGEQQGRALVCAATPDIN